MVKMLQQVCQFPVKVIVEKRLFFGSNLFGTNWISFRLSLLK